MQPELVQKVMIDSTSLRGVFSVTSNSWSNSNSSSSNRRGSPVYRFRNF